MTVKTNFTKGFSGTLNVLRGNSGRQSAYFGWRLTIEDVTNGLILNGLKTSIKHQINMLLGSSSEPGLLFPVEEKRGLAADVRETTVSVAGASIIRVSITNLYHTLNDGCFLEAIWILSGFLLPLLPTSKYLPPLAKHLSLFLLSLYKNGEQAYVCGQARPSQLAERPSCMIALITFHFFATLTLIFQ